MPAQKPKFYIGDSVYAEIDEFGDLVLTTENGSFDDPITNRIVLEPAVFAMLLEWMRSP
jgi:hypothetical protein